MGDCYWVEMRMAVARENVGVGVKSQVPGNYIRGEV